MVAPVRWFGYSSQAVTLGYYADFVPEAGSKGRGTIDDVLGGGRPARRPKLLPPFPTPSTGDSFLYVSEKSYMDCKVEEMGGLGKC